MKTGLFVEGPEFGLKEAQARAYARNLALQYGRPVRVLYRSARNPQVLVKVATFRPEIERELY